MAHQIDMTNGRANVAYLGSREDVWHKLGAEMQTGMSIDQWQAQAGLDWTAEQCAARMDIDSHPAAEGFQFTYRSDTKMPLGIGSDRRREFQPRETLEFISQYADADDRFTIDTAGSLKGGKGPRHLRQSSRQWEKPKCVTQIALCFSLVSQSSIVLRAAVAITTTSCSTNWRKRFTHLINRSQGAARYHAVGMAR